MTAADDAPTETSPLLPNADERPENGTFVNEQSGTHTSSDTGDVENQPNGEEEESRQKQYEGMPEMKKQMKWIFPALSIGVFLSAVDQSIIAPMAPQIGTELNALNLVSWIATAYFLTLTSFQSLSGKLSDIFGRKACILFSYFIFGLGNLLCGLAQNMPQLIAARAFAGIGGGGMTTVVSILMSDIIPLRERGTWQGYLNIIFAAGAGAGAPLGGVFADHANWRWAFLFQAPLCAVAILAVSLLLKLPKLEESDWKAKLRRIDFLGALLLICAVFSLLFGLDRGSNNSWSSPIALVPLCISFPLFAVFLYVEVKIAHEPFAPGRIIFSKSNFACYLCNFFSFSALLGAIFYIPIYWQAVGGYSATKAGALLVPGVISGVSGSLLGGLYMKRTGKYYWITVIGYTTMTIGVVLIFLFSGLITDSPGGMVVGTVFSGFGNGIGVTTTLIALISNAHRNDQAVVTACSYLFRTLGSSTGVSLTATVANQTLKSELMKRLGAGHDAEKIMQRARRSLSYIKTLEPKVREIVRSCFSLGSTAAFGLDVGLVLGTFIAAWFIIEKPLSKD